MDVRELCQMTYFRFYCSMVYSNLIDVTRRISFYVFLKRSKNFKNYQYRFICKQYLIQYSSIYPKKRGIVREKGTNYPTRKDSRSKWGRRWIRTKTFFSIIYVWNIWNHTPNIRTVRRLPEETEDLSGGTSLVTLFWLFSFSLIIGSFRASLWPIILSNE